MHLAPRGTVCSELVIGERAEVQNDTTQTKKNNYCTVYFLRRGNQLRVPRSFGWFVWPVDVCWGGGRERVDDGRHAKPPAFHVVGEDCSFPHGCR